MSIVRLGALALVALLLASCSTSARSDDIEAADDAELGVQIDEDAELGVQVDDPTQVDEIVVFDDGERSIVLVDRVQTVDGPRWSVEWSVDGEFGIQPAVFAEALATCAADTLRDSTDPFLAELRARGLNPGSGADGDSRLAVIEAMLGCDGGAELRELAFSSLPDFDAECLDALLVTDDDVLELYGLQNPDATIDERRPAAERFGPCLDLLANAPDTLMASSTECVRDGETELGTAMMLGADDFVPRLLDLLEGCLTPEEFAQMGFG